MKVNEKHKFRATAYLSHNLSQIHIKPESKMKFQRDY